MNALGDELVEKKLTDFVKMLRMEQNSKRTKNIELQELARFKQLKTWLNDREHEKIITEVRQSNALQFVFRPLWKNVVKPHLERSSVQNGLVAGLLQLDDSWKEGDAPWEAGNYSCDWSPAPVPGSLDYYQPQNRCYNMVLFSLELGKCIFPELLWRVMLNERHTVAVGILPESDPGGALHEFQARDLVVVCMDILFSDRGFCSDQSLDFADARITMDDYNSKWGDVLMKSTDP